MTYDEYAVKVRDDFKKIRSMLAWLKNHRVVLIASFAAIAAAVMLLLYFSGSFTKPFDCESHEYGSPSRAEARAFLARVDYGYSDGEGVFPGFPYRPGSYTVTAKTKSALGKIREQSRDIVISKKPAAIGLSDIEITYGDTPDFLPFVSSPDLCEGDRIGAVEVAYDPLTGGEAAIVSVKIENENGDDVTDCYGLTLGRASARIVPRVITVSSGTAEKKYDGETLTETTYTVKGKLAEGDEIAAVFSSSITIPGTVPNNMTVSIMHGGEDRTHMYDVRIAVGSLTVLPRQIRVKTGSAEKDYDGTPLSCEEYEIDGSELLEGHTVQLLSVPGRRNAGTYDNRIEFTVTDAEGYNVKTFYEFVYDMGKLKIRKLPLKAKSASGKFVYDAHLHYFKEAELTEGELLPGHSIVFDGFQPFIYGGEYKNSFIVVITSEDGAKVTSNYDIEFDPGTVYVEPRPITLRFTVTGNPGISKAFTVHADNGDSFDGEIERLTLNYPTVIPLSVKESDFGKYINNGLSIVNRDSTIVTSSYDAKIDVFYDPDLIAAVREQAPGRDTDTGTQTGPSSGTDTGTGTGPTPETEPPEPVDPEEAAMRKYGIKGVGTGGVSGQISNSPGSGSTVPGESQQNGKEPRGSVSSLKGGAIYLRLRSFGDYTGTGWSEPLVYDKSESMVIHPLNLTYMNLQGTFSPENTVIVNYRSTDNVKPVPYFSQTADSHSRYYVTDVAVPSDSDEGIFRYDQIPMVTLQNLLKDRSKSTDKYDDEYYEFVRENYLSVPDNIKGLLDSIIKEAKLDASSPDIIQQVAAFVRGYARYNGNFKAAPEGADLIAYFLGQSREGICAHFASAAVLIYRQLGIPARFTAGYYVVTEAAVDTPFYAKDAHSWPEVYVENIGWIPVEVTSMSVADGGESSDYQPPDESSLLWYNHVYFRMNDAAKTYDGEYLYSPGVLVLDGSNLLPGHTLSAESEGIMFAGSVKAYANNVKITDETGRDVTGIYQLHETSPGILTVHTLEVTLTEITLYVGQTIVLPKVSTISDAEAAALIGEDDLSFDFGGDPAMRVNEDGTATGVAATDQRTFSKAYNFGALRGSSVVTSSDEIIVRQKVTVLPFENVRYTSNPPKTTNTSTVYRVAGENGVMYDYLAVTADSAEKSFDGKYLTAAGFTVTGGAVEPGHHIVFSSNSSQLYVGSCENRYGVLSVLDEKGDDVTGRYLIDFTPGTLTVTEGVYAADDSVIVTVPADGADDLRKVVWVEGLSGLPVTYRADKNDGVVRVDGYRIIGIEAGSTKIAATLNSIDLNGDGVAEYGAAERSVTVNVTPKAKDGSTLICTLFIISVSAAVVTVTFVVTRYVMRGRKEE